MVKNTLALALALWITAGVSSAQTVSWNPAAPRIGDAVTFFYDSRVGSLGPSVSTLWMHWGIFDPSSGSWSTPPQAIWPAGSHLHSDNVAVQSPMTRGQDTVWSVTIDFDTSVHDMAFVFTDGSSQWDNNSGNNWIINFVQSGTVSWWIPEEPLPGDTVTIYYDCIPGTLPNAATTVILHWGINESGHGNWRLPPQAMWPTGTVASGAAARTPMISAGNGLYSITIATLDTIYSLHYVTTDGTNWDNNGNANWDILLEEPPPVTYTYEIFRFDPRSAFSQFSGTVSTVNLAGTFNGWSTSANPLTNMDAYGNRWGEVLMPVGYSEYKFVINGGNWQIDPDNPHNAAGYNNSVLELTVDSLPQIYNILPVENAVFDTGTALHVTMNIRPGDLGPEGLRSHFVVVDGILYPQTTWNAASGQLSFDWPAPSVAQVMLFTVYAEDSAGHQGERSYAYGFRSNGYMAVDPYSDLIYNTGELSEVYDLYEMTLNERANGDSLEMTIMLGGVTPVLSPLILVTISSSADGFGEIAGFGGEVHVPGLSSGGIALPLLDPQNSGYNAVIHNNLHPAGDINIPGAQVAVTADGANNTVTAIIAKSDLEDALGSYQTAWYYTCATYVSAGSGQGYCQEMTPDTPEAPDCIDVLFMMAADVQTKLMHNYGLTRRATLDAPGRGVAAITPQEIGPNVAAEGPLCRILTRGAPTSDTTQTIVARITSAMAVGSVWLTQNGAATLVALAGDSFTIPVTLAEGVNQFNAWAVNANNDTGRSPTMIFTLEINHAPDIVLSTSVSGGMCMLNASQTTDPEQQTITFEWTADADNPTAVTLLNANTSVASFSPPSAAGEYYFDVTATDPDQHQTRARTLFTITADSAHGFSNNECAEWVQNAIIYEVYPRSFSATRDLDGITADLQRIANLGVNCIWLMPIFDGPSDHGYEITDYYHIEQDYGTEEDLHELVNAAHALGIKIILDMVLNHTGIGHPFMQDAIRYGRYSHYWDWYDRDASGNYTYYYDWTSLPNLNLNNNEAVQYWIDMCKYWISEFDIDGYRCDVAWGPQQRSPQFWVKWRRALKEIKPEVLLLAEAGANDFTIFTNRFDLAFDWNLHHEGSSSFSNMFPQIPGFTNLTELVTNYGVSWPAYKFPLRFMENHDETRYISANTAAQTKLVSAFMMTIPGDVMLYAGQEIGTTSQRDAISWGLDPNVMYPHYYQITNARKLLPALRKGEFTLINNSQAGACYSFARHGSGMDPVIFAGNFTPASSIVTFTISASELGLNADSTYVVSELLGNTHSTMTGAQLTSLVTSLSAYQSRIWVVSDSAISVDAPPSSPLLPQRISLGYAYPNPFNPVTTLPLELSQRTHVRLRIFDILGREVATVINGSLDAGYHQLTWNSRDAGSGVYFAVMEAGDVHQVRKLVLIR
jgi:cyclomaltodextrinase / maltogenic alpha-amylase / neopullulanase